MSRPFPELIRDYEADPGSWEIIRTETVPSTKRGNQGGWSVQGDTVDATVSSPVTVDGNVIVSTGAKAKLKITSVEHTTKEGGSDHLLLALVELNTEQGDVRVSAPARQFDGPTLRGEQVKHGAIGAGIGAVGGFDLHRFTPILSKSIFRSSHIRIAAARPAPKTPPPGCWNGPTR